MRDMRIPKTFTEGGRMTKEPRLDTKLSKDALEILDLLHNRLDPYVAPIINDTPDSFRIIASTIDNYYKSRTPPESGNPKEREELVNIIKQPLVFEFVFNKNDYPVSLKFTPEKLADAILAAGFTKSNRVTLDEEQLTRFLMANHIPMAAGISRVICQQFGTTKNGDKGEK